MEVRRVKRPRRRKSKRAGEQPSGKPPEGTTAVRLAAALRLLVQPLYPLSDPARRRKLIAGLPAILALGAALTVTLLAPARSDLLTHYLVRSADAAGVGDRATSALCLRRVIDVRGPSPPLALRLARELIALDRLTEADELLASPLVDGAPPHQLQAARDALATERRGRDGR